MRRAYQKAVTIPLNNVEHLWKEYDQWENSLNRLTVSFFFKKKNDFPHFFSRLKNSWVKSHQLI